ncbi:MAG: hypothetical protein SGCHY_002614 [Lobulomycetales sp.]
MEYLGAAEDFYERHYGDSLADARHWIDGRINYWGDFANFLGGPVLSNEPMHTFVVNENEPPHSMQAAAKFVGIARSFFDSGILWESPLYKYRMALWTSYKDDTISVLLPHQGDQFVQSLLHWSNYNSNTNSITTLREMVRVAFVEIVGRLDASEELQFVHLLMIMTTTRVFPVWEFYGSWDYQMDARQFSMKAINMWNNVETFLISTLNEFPPTSFIRGFISHLLPVDRDTTLLHAVQQKINNDDRFEALRYFMEYTNYQNEHCTWSNTISPSLLTLSQDSDVYAAVEQAEFHPVILDFLRMVLEGKIKHWLNLSLESLVTEYLEDFYPTSHISAGEFYKRYLCYRFRPELELPRTETPPDDVWSEWWNSVKDDTWTYLRGVDPRRHSFLDNFYEYFVLDGMNVSENTTMLSIVLGYLERVDQFQTTSTSVARRAAMRAFTDFAIAWANENTTIEVTRDNLYTSTLKAMSRTSLTLALKVRFENESGIDEKGLTRYNLPRFNENRELLSLLAKEFVQPERGILSISPETQLADLNAESDASPDDFYFLGQIIQLALLKNEAFPISFVPSFYKKLLGRPVAFEDLKYVDQDRYKNMELLRNHSAQLEELEITFIATFDNGTEVELKPNGKAILVDAHNLEEYIRLYTEWKLVESTAQIFSLVSQSITAHPISTSTEEFAKRLSGQEHIDVADWKAHTEYSGSLHRGSPVVAWFWQYVESCRPEKRRKLLQFSTGCSRTPALGFAMLDPKFSIQPYHSQEMVAVPLIRSHTCFNSLDLPEYESYEILAQRIDLALEEGVGFLNA